MSQHSLSFTNERIDDKKSITEEIATSMSDFLRKCIILLNVCQFLLQHCNIYSFFHYILVIYKKC